MPFNANCWGGVMKFIRIILSLVFVSFVVCTPGPKEMTLEEFYDIQNEILNTDLTPESKEGILKKYGFTLKQYEEYDEAVKADPKMREKLGEIKMKREKEKMEKSE